MLMITFPGTFVTGETWWVLGSLTKWQNLRVPGHILSLALLRKRKIKTCRKPKLNPQYIPVMTWVNSKNERGMNEINVAPIQGTAVWPEPRDSICFPATLTRCCQRERTLCSQALTLTLLRALIRLYTKSGKGFLGMYLPEPSVTCRFPSSSTILPWLITTRGEPRHSMPSKMLYSRDCNDKTSTWGKHIHPAEPAGL